MAKAKAKEPDPTLSKREELCESCDAPLLCCPGTTRHFVRCCPTCTHRTENDVEWERHMALIERQRRRYKRRASV